jgi:glutamate--cysteine ligase
LPPCPPARPPAGEEALLEQLATIAHSGLSPADHLLALYEGRWGEDVGPVFEELHY